MPDSRCGRSRLEPRWWGSVRSRSARRSRADRGAVKRTPARRTTMLRTIFLNVSGRCNLSCAYCFAAQGAYRDAQRMMDLGRAQAAIDCLLEEMDDAGPGEVVFFG